ncbi:MAG: hypothetical protein CMO55_19795 [Verrucomicrobiales bacterium]|nr:hypothetical protein [Verrucomicrobiales bacterium]
MRYRARGNVARNQARSFCGFRSSGNWSTVPSFMMSIAIRLSCLVLVFVSAFSVTAADRVALVIGVDRYDTLPPEAQLEVAVQDATLLADTLESVDPPFQVTLLQDADWKSAQTSFDAFLDQAKNAECALIYFAGHGVEYHGENFLLVKDSDVGNISADVQRMKRRLGTGAISLQSWVDSLDASQANVKLVILDCCRDNPLQAEDGAGTRSTVGSRQGLAQVTPPTGTLISYSADAGQQANDGLFTPVLAKNIRESNFPILRVFATTREQVREISESWAQADSQKGIPSEFRRVRHEPAEYNKLNVAGMDFCFNKSAAPADDIESMEAKIAEMEKQLEEKRKQKGSEMVKRFNLISEALEKGTITTPSQGTPMSTRTSETGTLKDTTGGLPAGFSLSRAMEGKSAGEVRTIGGIPMVWCPAGDFLMGTPPSNPLSAQQGEFQHKVTFSTGFWMAKTECSQEQWESVVGSNPSAFKTPERPVDSVSYEDCLKWVEAKNKEVPLPLGWKWSLPSEAQWEYACRAGSVTAFHFGDQLPKDQAVFEGSVYTRDLNGELKAMPTVSTGSLKANSWGLHEMHGNVSEWCLDHSAPYSTGPVTDPISTSTENQSYIIRGGYYGLYPIDCRSASRFALSPGKKHPGSGFRPAVVKKFGPW